MKVGDIYIEDTIGYMYFVYYWLLILANICVIWLIEQNI